MNKHEMTGRHQLALHYQKKAPLSNFQLNLKEKMQD
jgi:hypothetical protein